MSDVNKALREQADHMRANAAKLKPMDPQEARARELAALYVEEIAIANDIDERLQRGTARVAATDIDAVLATVRKYAIPGHSVVMPIINSILKEIDAMRSPSVVVEDRAPEGWMVAFSGGKTKIMPGDVWHCDVYGGRWRVLWPVGQGMYSPSGLGGTPTFLCQLESGQMPAHYAWYADPQGRVEFCGDSIAAALARQRSGEASSAELFRPCVTCQTYTVCSDARKCQREARPTGTEIR